MKVTSFIVVLLLMTGVAFADPKARVVPDGSAVIEPQRQVPITHTADVVVIGASDGGLGGCTAAVAAARRGAKVILIDGGGSIQLHVPISLGFVIGIQGWRPTIEEGLLRDYARYCSEAGQYARIPLTFEPTLAAGEIIVRYHDVATTAMLRMLQDAKVQTLFHTQLVDCVTDDGRIQAVIVQSPRGRHAIAGKMFVDSTALGDLAAAAGAPMKREEAFMGEQAIITGVDESKFRRWQDENNQPLDDSYRKWMESLVGPFDQLKYPWDQWFPEYLGDRMKPAVVRKARQAQEKGDLTIVRRRGDAAVAIVEGIKSNPNVAVPRTYVTGVDPLGVEALTWAETASREALLEFQTFLQKYVPGFEQCVLERVSARVGMRGGRYIDIGEEITSQLIERGQQNRDCIYVEMHGTNAGLYEVPFRALLPQKVENLLVVGKATGGGKELRTAHGVLLQGQAAGTAALLSLQQNVTPRKIDIAALQRALREDGINLPYDNDNPTKATAP